MNGGRRSWAAAALAVVVLMPTSCGDATTDRPQAEPTLPPTATATPAPPEPSAAPARPTVEGIAADLQGVFDSVFGGWADPAWSSGSVQCPGSGQAGEGATLTCYRDHPGQPEWIDTVYVVVLDDTGRYAFTSPHAQARPDDYPPGSADCDVLSAPPVDVAGREDGLDYVGTMFQWMRLGRPSSMDPDDDGRPCEANYPPEVIDQILASPLSPSRQPTSGPVAMEKVRQHASAVLTGTLYPTALVDCSGGDMAIAGATLMCRTSPHLLPQQTFDVYVAVLDDAGRYWMAWTQDYPGFRLEDWPVGAGCAELSRPAPGYEGLGGLPYGSVVWRWGSLGRPGDWDTDGDGRPCEDYWPADQVDAVVDSTLQP